MPSNTTMTTTTTVVATLATILVARVTWQNTPQWVKEGLVLRGKSSTPDDHEDANDDLANPATVYLKIKEVLNLSYELCEDLIPDDMPYYKLYCCFMSMVHLMNEIDANDPNWRESYFARDGADVGEAELETLLKYLELAQWAYNPSLTEVQKLLRPLGYKLIRHDPATEPGRVGHFIAVHHDKKQVVLAIKGTSSLSDVLTDIIGKAIPHTHDGGLEIRYHEGMYVAAKMMLDDTLHMIENFFIPKDYKIVVCGHSLGAGVSSLLGMLLKQHLPDLKLQVYAFATPACCSYDASTDCNDYITSVVNNNDCVPRMSLLNVRMMHKLFMLIDGKLDEKNLSPKDFWSAKNYLKDLMKIDNNLLLTPRELTNFFEEEFAQPHGERFIDMELYVPGRVVSIWNHTSDASILGGKVTTGHSRVLKQIFVEKNMVSDHGCDCYRQNLQNLLEQKANTI
jgi:hypothetical protein